MGLVCIQNSSLLVYSESHKVWASYCLPFQHCRGKNQPVGGFRPPCPAFLGLRADKLFETNCANTNIKSVSICLKVNEMKYAAQVNWDLIKGNCQQRYNFNAWTKCLHLTVQQAELKRHVIYDHITLLYAGLVWHFLISIKCQRKYIKDFSILIHCYAPLCPLSHLALLLIDWFEGNEVVSYEINQENNGLWWCGNLFKKN